MSHLIICLGEDSQGKIRGLLKRFDNVYAISEDIEELDTDSLRPEQKISLLLMPDMPIKQLSEALLHELKSQLSKDKIVDLDIAVNISSGSGKIHSATISAIMKLGYGIRLVDIDDKGDIVEL